MPDYAHAVSQAHLGGYNQGKVEGRKELLNWILGRCYHPLPLDCSPRDVTKPLQYPEHRYECEICMLELEREKNANQKNIQEKS